MWKLLIFSLCHTCVHFVIPVSTMAGMVERLELISHMCGLNCQMSQDGHSVFISCESFFINITMASAPVVVQDVCIIHNPSGHANDSVVGSVRCYMNICEMFMYSSLSCRHQFEDCTEFCWHTTVQSSLVRLGRKNCRILLQNYYTVY